jgi:hypothetical protein
MSLRSAKSSKRYQALSGRTGQTASRHNQRMFEEFGHRGWEAFAHAAEYPEIAEAFQHAIQTGTPYQGVMRLRRADDEFRWHDARYEPSAAIL